MLTPRHSFRRLRLPPNWLALLPRTSFPLTSRTFGTAPRRREEERNIKPLQEPTVQEYLRGVREQWGDYLPKGLLSESELKLYERFYGKPLRMLEDGELSQELEGDGEREGFEQVGDVTLRDSARVEVVAGARGVAQDSLYEENSDETYDEDEIHGDYEGTDMPEPQNSAEAEIYRQVERNIQTSRGKKQEPGGGDEAPTEVQDNPDDFRWGSDRFFKTHPLTSIGRFATFPTTIQLPEAVQDTTDRLLVDEVEKHLQEAARNSLGGPQFHKTPITTAKRSRRILEIPLSPSLGRMTDMEANVFISAVMPGLYAQALSALTELRRRLGGGWVLGGEWTEHGVERVLDVGSGGAAVLAWRNIIEAEEARRKEMSPKNSKQETPPQPPHINGLRAAVVVGSESLRHRVSKFLDNTTFLPHLPLMNPYNLSRPPDPYSPETDPNPQPRKPYDLIISTNGLLPLHHFPDRRVLIDTLWSHLNPNGGVLLFIEKGTPMGFEAIAGARSTLLKNKIAGAGSTFEPQPDFTGNASAGRRCKETAAIVAPCTNHEQCPMFIQGHTDGTTRKDYCRFSQRYQRPPYLQKLMLSGKKNHEDLEYSFIAVRRGVDHRQNAKDRINPSVSEFKQTEMDAAPGVPVDSLYTSSQLRNYTLTLPRVILQPLKAQGHVTLDVCTPQGNIERWVVPRSYDKLAYRDARKSKWGDLWALGAKTKSPRNIKTGVGRRKSKSKLVATVDPFGVKRIEKDKSGKMKLKRKLAEKRERMEMRLKLKEESKERHLAMVARHKAERGERRKKDAGIFADSGGEL